MKTVEKEDVLWRALVPTELQETSQKSKLPDPQIHPAPCLLAASPGAPLWSLVFCCVLEGFPDYHSHKLSCSVTHSLWVLNMTDWALKKLCNGDHRAQETGTCFPGITGENSVVYRRQLRGCEPWETMITFHNLDPPNPIIYCQCIFKTIWNLWFFS